MSFECENCLRMPEYGCYCAAMGAASAGGPTGEDSLDRVRSCIMAMAGIDDPVGTMDRLWTALETARRQLITLGGDTRRYDYGDSIQSAVLGEVDRALLSRMEVKA